MGLYSGGVIYGRGVAYIRQEKHFSLQSVKLTFLVFFQYKARILAFFTSCKILNMFKVNNKDTRIRKVNDEVKNKDTVDVVLASLLLTLNSLLLTFYLVIFLTIFPKLVLI